MEGGSASLRSAGTAGREFRFRAWDGKAMRSDVCLDMGDLRIASANEMLSDPDLVVMQWTGLKDRDGVEIYEGDVIQHPEHWDDERTLSVVRYDSDRAFFYPFGASDYSISPRSENLKVIGNVWEHPERVNG